MMLKLLAIFFTMVLTENYVLQQLQGQFEVAPSWGYPRTWIPLSA